MNQKDAVYEMIKQLKPREVDQEVPVALTKQEKRVVEQKLFDGFRQKKIQYNSDLPSDDKLAMYVSGLVSNWLRKDRRLNGNTTYAPKRPGSRLDLAQPNAPKVETRVVSPAELDAIKAMAAPGEEVTVYVVRRRSESDEENNSGPSQH